MTSVTRLYLFQPMLRIYVKLGHVTFNEVSSVAEVHVLNYWHVIQTTAFRICLTSVTRAKCGTRSTLCWKIRNISGSTEFFCIVILDYGLKLHKLSIHTLVMLQK